MIDFFALAMTLIATPAQASTCNAKEAIRVYYQAGNDQQEIEVLRVKKGLFTIRFFDQIENAECTGGLARVDANCEVEVVRALFCERK